jgi:type II restriction/modification system DNA methylase subunit YeeA
MYQSAQGEAIVFLWVVGNILQDHPVFQDQLVFLYAIKPRMIKVSKIVKWWYYASFHPTISGHKISSKYDR